jgi:MFS family permease
MTALGDTLRARASAFTGLSRDNRLLALSLLVWGTGEGLFLHIQPLYLEQLGADSKGIGQILAASQLVLGLSFVPAGWLADRVGYRRLLIAGWLLGLAAALGMAFAPDLRTFVMALLVYGLSGFVVPVMSSYITAARGRATVEHALATVYAAFALGSIPSPALGGWIADNWGLPAVYRSAVVFIAISSALVFLLGERRGAHAEAGTVPNARLWRDREFRLLVGLMFAGMALLWLPWTLTPNFLRNERGFEIGDIGLLGTVSALGAIVMQLWLGRRRPRQTLPLAYLLMLGAVLLLWQARVLALLGVAYFLRSSLNLARVAGSSLAARVAGAHRLGLAYGMIETTATLAITSASVIAGYLYDARPDLPYLVAAIGLPVLAGATLLLAPRVQGLPPTPAVEPP